MNRPALAMVLLLAFAASAAAQEEEQFAAGRRYLEKVARIWSAKLPNETVAGAYLADKWVGWLRTRIQAAPKDSGAAFEITASSEIAVQDQIQKSRMHVFLGPGLAPISGEEDQETSGVHRTRKLTVQRGCWRMAIEEGGLTHIIGGELKPATTWEATSLLFYAIPDDAVTAIRDLEAEESVRVIRMQEGVEQRSVLANRGDFARFDMPGTATALDLYFYADESHRALEMNAPKAALRILSIDESAVGKDLDAGGEIVGPVKAVLDLFHAIKRGDKDALLACFDFEKFAADAPTPAAGEGGEPQVKETVDEVRERMVSGLLTTEEQAWLPDDAGIENLLGPGFTYTESDGTAEVTDPTESVWVLTKGAEGKWRITGESE